MLHRWLVLWGWGAWGMGLAASSIAQAGPAPQAPAPPARPNVLWITAEDHGPHLGCYGDTAAKTPHLDRLAARGLRYERCWSVCPVCAPARTALITGMYPSALGAEHMRSLVPLPRGAKLSAQWLREAGYYCTNNAKEDYNVSADGRVWDESSAKAHWKNRPADKPFFAVFNFTGSHESRMHRLAGKVPLTDPAAVRVPAYHPDTPEVRRDWAHYHDGVNESDTQAGKLLAELEAAGLADNTIVFYYADHGAGLARSKRSACDSGLRVPLIVHFPERFRHLAPPDYTAGGVSRRLVSFVDFAPTLLAVCGAAIPPEMHGTPFAGPHVAAGPPCLFGSRGRMDERHDLVRCVTDGRFVYVRNLLPHRPHGQHVDYQFKGPLTRAWQAEFAAGRTNPAQSFFWTAPRPAEELYDLAADPDEVVNLAAAPAHQEDLVRLRAALQDHTQRRGDCSLWPESEMLARAAGRSPRDVLLAPANADEAARVALAAFSASLPGTLPPAASPASTPRGVADESAAVRYWAIMRGLLPSPPHQGGEREPRGESPDWLERQAALVADPPPAVRIAAAERVAQSGNADDTGKAVEVLVDLLRTHVADAAVLAESLSALERLAEQGRVSLHAVTPCKTLPDTHPAWEKRVAPKIALLRDRVLSRAVPR